MSEQPPSTPSHEAIRSARLSRILGENSGGPAGAGGGGREDRAVPPTDHQQPNVLQPNQLPNQQPNVLQPNPLPNQQPNVQPNHQLPNQQPTTGTSAVPPANVVARIDQSAGQSAAPASPAFPQCNIMPVMSGYPNMGTFPMQNSFSPYSMMMMGPTAASPFNSGPYYPAPVKVPAKRGPKPGSKRKSEDLDPDDDLLEIPVIPEDEDLYPKVPADDNMLCVSCALFTGKYILKRCGHYGFCQQCLEADRKIAIKAGQKPVCPSCKDEIVEYIKGKRVGPEEPPVFDLFD